MAGTSRFTISRSGALARLAAVAVSPAALVARTSEAQGQTPKTFRFLGLPVDDSKSVFYGVRAGIFRRYGLTVETRLIGSGPAASAALIGGSADVILTNIVTLLQAHERGIPMKILSAAAWYFSDKANTFLLAPKDAAIRTAADLNGKTVGTVSLGGIFLVAIRAWIDQNGGDSRTVNIIEVPASAIVSMLEQGRVAVAASNEPGTSEALQTGKVRIFGQPMDSIGKRYEAAAFAVMETAVAREPDGYRRFAQAMHEAQAYTNAHDAETVDLVASFTGTPAELVAKSVRASDPEYVEARNIQPVIDMLAKYGALKARFAADAVISNAALKRPG